MYGRTTPGKQKILFLYCKRIVINYNESEKGVILWRSYPFYFIGLPETLDLSNIGNTLLQAMGDKTKLRPSLSFEFIETMINTI